MKENIEIDVTVLPANIDRSKECFLQICEPPMQSVILYECKLTGKQSRMYISLDFAKGKKSGIYVITQKAKKPG